MEVFQDYAYYYNAFYKDKDYKSEALNIDYLIKKYAKLPVASILNVGCGTGRHDIELNKLGYDVTGIDMSSSMIEIAKKNNPNIIYEVGDARDYRADREFDAVISLFHVVSYQNTNGDVEAMFRRAYGNIKKGGIFLFDVWFEAGVLSEKPEVRIKKVEDDENILIRHANPVMHADTNIVDVNYEVLIINKASGKVKHLEEVHCMRYFSKPELMYILEKCGFQLLECCSCNTLSEVDYTSWTAYFVAQKL